MANKNPNQSGLKKCKKGETHNPNGRPKNMLTILKGQGLSRTDYYNAIEYMLNMSKPALTVISKSETDPVWKISIARAILKDIALGYYSTVESLFDRLFGKAKQSTSFSGPEGEPITGITIKFEKPK